MRVPDGNGHPVFDAAEVSTMLYVIVVAGGGDRLSSGGMEIKVCGRLAADAGVLSSPPSGEGFFLPVGVFSASETMGGRGSRERQVVVKGSTSALLRVAD